LLGDKDWDSAKVLAADWAGIRTQRLGCVLGGVDDKLHVLLLYEVERFPV
jgi:hypothetical protein